MKKIIAATILTIAAPAFAGGLLFGQSTVDKEAVYERGADSGVHDLCQEVGGRPHTDAGYSQCDMPEVKPIVITKTKVKVKKVKVEVPVTRVVTKTVPATDLQCPDGFVAWDQRRGGGEWAYCEDGTRPALAK